jgi:aromatic-L-amino-acid decarboxylase
MNNKLTITPDEMRKLGYGAIDLIVDHFEHLSDKPVLKVATPGELKKNLDRVLPEDPTDIDSVMNIVSDHILGNISHGDHPRFFAFVPGPSNFVGAMADAMAAGLNICSSNWLEASGPAEIERITIAWLADLCGFPEEAGGTFVSGGSMANLTAVAVARQVLLGDPDPNALVYYADQAHISIFRGLRVLGFSPKQLRQIPTDENFRLDPVLLEKQIVQDHDEGKRPFCVIANGGTTNTGAVDPLRAIAAICQSRDMWLHVDGAYGAGSVISERGRKQLDGLGLAHSITIDPHKWLFQPIESGCILVRDRNWLREAFDVSPEYLKDVDERDGEINYYQQSVQLTRQTRALKLWMSLKVFGARAFRSAVDAGFENAEYLEAKIKGMKDWEVITPATLGIVTFRFSPGGLSLNELNELNQLVADRLTQSGVAFVATTVLKGIKALRMCPINPRTSEEDLDRTLRKLTELGDEI